MVSAVGAGGMGEADKPLLHGSAGYTSLTST
jgi:hypothetical protein